MQAYGSRSERPAVLFINQHYYPDHAATGQILTDLAEYLAAEGFRVGVICSRGRYLSGSLRSAKHEVHKGVEIFRLGATSFGRSSNAGRLIDYATFFGKTLVKLLQARSYDYAVTLTTPPLLSSAAALVNRLTGRRYGIWSMDLHPEAEVAAGMLREKSFAWKTVNGISRFGYSSADFIVTLGTVMRSRLTSGGVPADIVHTIPVWCPREETGSIDSGENTLRSELGLDDKFIVMYSGNAGLAHRFDEVLETMDRMKDDPDVYFLFVGDGPRKKEILAFTRQHNITNFRYLDYFPREKLSHALALGDVHLLTLQENMAGIAVPSKLYGVMAAARPVLMVGPDASEPGETILESGCGAVFDPARMNGTAVSGLQDTIRHLRLDASMREDMGRKGRKAFQESFERSVACGQWAELLTSLNGRGTGNGVEEEHLVGTGQGV